MEQFDGDISGIGESTCGQEITIDFLEQLRETPEDEPPNPLPKSIGGGNYSLVGPTWEERWIFRRANTSASDANKVEVNDISIKNWLQGNNYGGQFFYLSPSQTRHQRDTNQWQGGVNLDTILNAERQSYGCHYWFRENAPA
jgi:hypothetical protein